MSQANRTQVELLTQYMESHPDLAKSFSAKSCNSKNSHRLLWEKLTNTLNANGPPSKSIAEWKRVWTIRKYHAKQKLVRNKKSISQTGGGPFEEHPLDANEEAIVQACGMDAVVSGISGVPSFGCEEELQNLFNTVTNDTLPLESEVTDVPSVTEQYTTKPTQKKKTNTSCNDNFLAKKQIELQEKFLEDQKENFNCVMKSLDNINESLKKQTSCMEREMGSINESLKKISDGIEHLCVVKEKEGSVSNALKKEELVLKRMELELAKALNEIKFHK